MNSETKSEQKESTAAHTQNMQELTEQEIEEILKAEAEANRKAMELIKKGDLSDDERLETERFYKRLDYGRFHSKPKPKNEEERKHWEKVNQGHREWTREEFKAILWSKMQQYLKGDFVPDGNFVRIINDLIDYFRGESDKYSQDKGIFLWGGVGIGKTMIMRSFSQMMYNTPMSFDYKPLKDIFLEMTKYSNTETLDVYCKGNYCFDDLGFESPTVQIYGNTINVWEEIIQKRYSYFQAGGQLTHVTSNICPYHDDTIPNLLDNYGERIESRCREMFHYIHLEGNDKRK